MKITSQALEIEMQGVGACDITPKVEEIVKKAGIKAGHALIFTKHTTTALKINENEERLLEDIKLHLEKIAPKNAKYLHDDIELRDCPPDERINGHSHIKALALNTSEIVPVIDRKLALGKWQSILFFELDGKRKREIIVQVCGE